MVVSAAATPRCNRIDVDVAGRRNDCEGREHADDRAHESEKRPATDGNGNHDHEFVEPLAFPHDHEIQCSAYSLNTVSAEIQAHAGTRVMLAETRRDFVDPRAVQAMKG